MDRIFFIIVIRYTLVLFGKKNLTGTLASLRSREASQFSGPSSG